MLKLYMLILSASIAHAMVGQSSIQWQQNFGTEYYDDALKLIQDPEGNIIVMGTEKHVDITGNPRPYLMVTKMDPAGQEVWKAYHDVALETHNLPGDYIIGKHFYSEHFGQRILNVVISFQAQDILYMLEDVSGAFHSYQYIQSPVFTLTQDQVEYYASVECSVQLACYGPDSLFIQRINPVPDSNFNVIGWTFEMKQHHRTAPIQGHYDFDLNDIATDEEGNVYLLAQIERWDFLFCTDCNDIFIDGWSMLFKIDSSGNLLDEKRLNITTAVVSSLSFISVSSDEIVIRINDINQAGTAVETSVFKVNDQLDIEATFTLDRVYNYLITDDQQFLYAVTNVYDPNDPEIKGESDALVVKFNPDGEIVWRSYYGGSSFDFPKGITVLPDGSIIFLANTSSDDFDVAFQHGYQDIWVVSLKEEITGIGEEYNEISALVYPNPVNSHIHVESTTPIKEINVFDAMGALLFSERNKDSAMEIDFSGWPAGLYVLQIFDDHGNMITRKVNRI